MCKPKQNEYAREKLKTNSQYCEHWFGLIELKKTMRKCVTGIKAKYMYQMIFCNSHLTCNIFNLYMRRFFFGLVYNWASTVHFLTILI